MKKTLWLVPLTLTLTLSACGGGGSTAPTTPAATSGTINGVRVLDANTYQVGFTPLDGTQVVSTATLTSVTVTDLSAGAATASVCGNVQGQSVISTAITLDSTGSMSFTDPNQLRRDAAKAFVARLRSSDTAAVLSFDTDTTPSAGMNAAYQWQAFTSDKTALNTAIDKATFDGGATPLYDAVIDASKLAKANAGSGKPGVLVLTDGEDNSSSADVAAAIAAAKANGTAVYAIGLDAGSSLAFTDLQNLASQTGGLFQIATDAKQLQTFFDQVFNSFVAQGCVQINFTNKPAANTVITGKLHITVSAANRKDAVIDAPFSITVR